MKHSRMVYARALRAACMVDSVLILERRVFFFQAEDGIRDIGVTGVQTCALPIYRRARYRLDHEPPGDVARDAFPHPGLYQGVGEERHVRRTRAMQGRRRVEHALRQDRKSVV